ncbi:MAG: EamA family transporter [Lentisphaeria bacterium]|nr:EamA family transporter [Lentisphaeria bacterium]
MFAGIGAGLLSVLFICGSYIFSREYMHRNNDAVKLAVFSQLVMTAGGIILLVIYSSFSRVPCSMKFFLTVAGQVVTFLAGQTSFFMLLHKVESSRASALLGLKLMALALISALIGKTLLPYQWYAVLLCTIAAVGMNFSGGRMSLSSCLWLVVSVVSYALCDMCVTELMLMMQGNSMLFNSFGVVGVCFTAIGIAVTPALFKYRLSVRELKAALPYSLFYFLSMIFLYTSFGIIGVVFGSIIQSGRGIVSVLLGMILLHYGLDRNEQRISKAKWVQRFIFAALMLCGMLLYSAGGRFFK